MTVIINPIEQMQTIAINSAGVGLGSLPNGATESLIELKYDFDNIPNFDNGLQKGDLCIMQTTASGQEGSYESLSLLKADTNTPNQSTKNVFIFISRINGIFTLMHKGYVEYENLEGGLQSWRAGETLYVNEGKLSLSPPQTSNNWVKSIGFCFPNINNKLLIWFEPDSTVFTIA